MKFLKLAIFAALIAPLAVSAQSAELTFRDAVSKIFAAKKDYFKDITGDSVPATSKYDHRNYLTFTVKGCSSATITRFFTTSLTIAYGPYNTAAEAEKKEGELASEFSKLKSSYKLVSYRNKDNYLCYSGQETVAGGRRDEDVELYSYKSDKDSKYYASFVVKGGPYDKVFKSLTGKQDKSSELATNLIALLNDVKNEFSSYKGEEVDQGGYAIFSEYKSKICLPGAIKCEFQDILGIEFIADMYVSSNEAEATTKYNDYVAKLKKALGDQYEYDDTPDKDEKGKHIDFFNKNFKSTEKAGGIKVIMEKSGDTWTVRIKVIETVWRF